MKKMAQLAGHVTNPVQRTSSATGQTCHSLRSNKVRWSCGKIKSRSLLAHVADLARDQHRGGGRVVLAFPWTWNMLTTWRIQSVHTEAPFLCAREVRKEILSKCADAARLVGRSRCCKSPISLRLVQSHDVSVEHVRQPFRQKRTMRFASGDKNSLSKRNVQSVGFTPTLVTLRIRRSQRSSQMLVEERK